ncbi:hypothetical protein [Bdellovibrio sp.]|uniref:hypothetical protein n=1 Tax=Bdellovibrio sp. TaxID=28201 RepID=UPI0039E2EE6A
MKSMITALILTFTVACSSLPPTSSRLSLTQIDSLNLMNLNTVTAKKELGAPDIKDYTDSSHQEETWLYLAGEPTTTRLSLIFNAATGNIISAHWFMDDREPESELNRLIKRYPKASFDIKNPTKKESIYGPSLFYQSSTTPLTIIVDERTNSVSAMSWTANPSLTPSGRKPTSH